MKDDSVDEFEIFLVWHFVGELRIFSKNVSSQIIVTKFTVEKKQIAESFRQERRIFKQKVQFFK